MSMQSLLLHVQITLWIYIYRVNILLLSLYRLFCIGNYVFMPLCLYAFVNKLVAPIKGQARLCVGSRF